MLAKGVQLSQSQKILCFHHCPQLLSRVPSAYAQDKPKLGTKATLGGQCSSPCFIPPTSGARLLRPCGRRHSTAVVWAAKAVQASEPADASDHDEEAEFDEYEDEWEDDFEMEEFEEAEEDEQQGSSPAAVAHNVKQIPFEQQTVQYTPDDFVEVGLVSKAHGIKGEVKVQLITDEPKKRLGIEGRRLWLQRSTGRGSTAAGNGVQLLQRVTVQWGRIARPASKDRRAEWAVKFKEAQNRDQAEALAGHKLLLALCDREVSPRAKDEFFITDLVGLKALDADSNMLMGIVTEVYDNASSYSLLRVRLAPNEADIQESKYRSILVPFVQDMVPTVDLAAGQLLLCLPEGLLETASSKKLRRPYTTEQQAQLRKQLLQRQQQQ